MYENFSKMMLDAIGGLNDERNFESRPDVIQKSLKELDKILDNLNNNRTIPEKYPDIVSKSTAMCIVDYHTDLYEYRDKVVQAGGFSLVSYDWVRALKENIIKNGKCLEIMAGSGMLSKALQDVGVNIIPTDNKSWLTHSNSFLNYYDWFNKPYTDVEKIDCLDAIKKYGKDVDFVIVSWPYMDDTCYRALLTMREVNPNCIMIYIGEFGEMTACADEDFANEAKCLNEDGLFDNEKVNNGNGLYKGLLEVNRLYKAWYGMNDYIELIK